MWKKEEHTKISQIILYVCAGLLVVGVFISGTILFNTIDELSDVAEYSLPEKETDEATTEELYNELLAYEGRWEGQWTNSTFNTSGTITVDIDVKPNGVILAEYDLEGFVFGWLNPNKRQAEGVYNKDGVFFIVESDYIFGDVKVHAKRDKTVAISGLKIPLRRVNAVSADGTFDETNAMINYNVNFIGTSGGSTGIVELTKIEQKEAQ